MNIAIILRILLIILTVASTGYFCFDCYKHKEEITGEKAGIIAIIGVVTNFFDTWGIGSYAPTTAALKFTKSTDDRTLPGTLNIGDSIPVSIEAILFMTFVDMDGLTLVLMLAASVVGAYLGAGIVSKWNINVVRLALGTALILTAIVSFSRTAGIGPFAGMDALTATGLTGVKLVIGVVGNFFLGALMMIGFGLYSPCMALISLLGMNIGAAFPIMMGSCAFLMDVAVFRFVREGAYDRKAALIIGWTGAVGVIVAYLLAKYAFSLTTLTYIVCCVMILTAIIYFSDVAKAKKQG